MQRFVSLILLFILTSVPLAAGGDDLLQTANNIYRLSEEMVSHGAEGHLHEIVGFGEKMIREIDKLTHDLNPLKRPKEKELKKQIKAIRDKTEEAIVLAKKGNHTSALVAAKSASFQAKRIRQELR